MSGDDGICCVCKKWFMDCLCAAAFEVYHPDGESDTPKFATWSEAIAKQIQWNRDCPGHIARKVSRAKPTQKRNSTK